MDILFRGEPPGEKQYEATCRTCKTRVRFKRHEATKHDGDPRDPREGPYLTVTCPVCRHVITAYP